MLKGYASSIGESYKNVLEDRTKEEKVSGKNAIVTAFVGVQTEEFAKPLLGVS